MKKYVMAGLGIVFLCVVSAVHAEMEVKVKDNTANNGFSIKEETTSSTIARFRGDGNVGIGTTAPNQKLTVAGTIESTTGGFKFPDGTTQVTASSGGGGLQVKLGSFTRDTSLPSGTQSITGVEFKPKAVIFLMCEGTTNKVCWGFDTQTDHHNIYQRNQTTSIFNHSSASIYISQSATDEYTGTVQSFDTDGFTMNWVKGGSPTGTPVIHYLALGESTDISSVSFNDRKSFRKYAMYVNNNGNVGIGYTSPSYKLDVNGTIRGSNVSPSDMRWKEHVKTLDYSLEKVNKLRGVSFEWKDKTKGAGTQVGLIAQEVEAVIPEVVSEDNEGYKSVAYDKLVGVLVEAIKEQQKQIEELKAEKDIEIVALKASNESLRQEIDSIKRFMSTYAQSVTVPVSAQPR